MRYKQRGGIVVGFMFSTWYVFSIYKTKVWSLTSRSHQDPPPSTGQKTQLDSQAPLGSGATRSCDLTDLTPRDASSFLTVHLLALSRQTKENGCTYIMRNTRERVWQ